MLRLQVLTQAAKKTFGLFLDPFKDDVQNPDDVFASTDIRYVRNAMYHTATHGGFIAVVGESGAGKSTLREDLVTRVQNDNKQVIFIEPFVLGLEDNDIKGKTLKANAISEAVINELDSTANVKRSSQARFAQMHKMLKESAAVGNKHCLIIEEAHGLSIPTLKHLKRFYELKNGLQSLISIVLIGQPELRLKLSDRNPNVREVVQRCELVTLEPLDSCLEDYIAFKLKRIGKDIEDIFNPNSFAAIQQRLRSTNGNRNNASLMHPLAVNNVVAAAMNLAAELGVKQVDADIIAGIQ